MPEATVPALPKASSGKLTRTAKPPPGSGPASHVPPCSAARSRMPIVTHYWIAVCAILDGNRTGLVSEALRLRLLAAVQAAEAELRAAGN